MFRASDRITTSNHCVEVTLIFDIYTYIYIYYFSTYSAAYLEIIVEFTSEIVHVWERRVHAYRFHNEDYFILLRPSKKRRLS